MRQVAGLDGLGETQRRTPAGGMRGQQRVIRRVAHQCRECAGRLGLGRDHVVADRTRGELDAVPRQHVRGDELGESRQRPPAHIRHRAGFDESSGEAVRVAHVCVGEPGHDSHLRRYTSPCSLLRRSSALRRVGLCRRGPLQA